MRGPSPRINLKIEHSVFHAVQANGAMLLEHTTTQFVKTVPLVSTHQPLECQKNPVALIAHRGDLVKKVATLHQLGDAKTVTGANIEEMIRNPHHAQIVSQGYIRTRRVRCRVYPAHLESTRMRQEKQTAKSVKLDVLKLN